MSVEDGETPWAFPPLLYSLLKLSFTSGVDHVKRRDHKTKDSEAIGNGKSSLSLDHSADFCAVEPETGFGLGHFEQIYEHFEENLKVPRPGNGPKDPKIVKWRDGIDGADLANDNNPGNSLSLSGLSTTQQRNANKRNGRSLATKLRLSTAVGGTGSTENKSGKGNKKDRSPDRKGVIHNILYGTSPTPNGSPGKQRAQVLKRPQLPIDIGACPVAKPHASNANLQPCSSEPAPTAYAIAAERQATLMTMLKERFPDERQYLKSISLFPHANNDSLKSSPEGLHVFIDASNIMIGFHDALKESRSLPKEHHMKRQPFSFLSLSLLLTRGRPTSKLVLVGSDNFPTIIEAKTLGYETNILDRVHKAKELTPRQKKHIFPKSGKGERSAGSGSETGLAATATITTHADKKWVEQAVDEILHLKMMESVVDCAEPGTMVLGSGDAAEAEYSGGFLKMIERAMAKGWKVEVACFRANTSGMYRRKEFREKWAGKFKLVQLDDFIEFILGVE